MLITNHILYTIICTMVSISPVKIGTANIKITLIV
jgi:hypothetical protein